MRRASCKLGLMVMMLGGLLVLGCSGGDVLDEMGYRYTIDSTTIFDGSTERIEIDPTTTDPGTMEITFRSHSSENRTIHVNEIVTIFTLLDASDDEDPPPPQIFGGPYINSGWIPPNNGTLTVTLETFFTAGMKSQYVGIVGEARAESLIATYRVDIIANCSYSRGGSTNITLDARDYIVVMKMEEEEEEEETPE